MTNLSNLCRQDLPLRNDGAVAVGTPGSGSLRNDGAPAVGTPGSGSLRSDGAPAVGTPGSGSLRNDGAPAVGTPGRGSLRNDGAPAVGTPGSGSLRNDGAPAVGTQDQVLFPGEHLFDLEMKKGNHLPHWMIGHAVYHICFRLFDSVPAEKLAEWKAERENFLLQSQKGRELTAGEIARWSYLHSEKVEEYLDAGRGSCLLRNDGVLAVVKETLLHDNELRYRIHAYGIMPNHVHVAVEFADHEDMPTVVQTWKSVSAHRINRLLNRKDDVWQIDYYNHVIRSAREYAFQVNYIFRNNLLCSWKLPRDGEGAVVTQDAVRQGPIALEGEGVAQGECAASPLRVALYVDKGCRGVGVVNWAELLRDSPDIDVRFIDGAEIRGGALDDRELLVVPGGWGGPQYEAMGDEGAAKVRAFVANGGRYFGTCCGLSDVLNEEPGFAKRLKMVPLKRIADGSRGEAPATVTFNKLGAEWLGIHEGDWTIRFNNGPIVEFTDPVPNCTQIDVLATMNCEICVPGKQPVSMFGTPGVFRAYYGKGLMLVFNCHPEAYISTQKIVAGGLSALSGREIRLGTPPVKRRGAERVGYLVSDALISSKTALEGFFTLRANPDINVRPVLDNDLDRGMGPLFDRIVKPTDLIGAPDRTEATISGPFPLLCTPYAEDGSLDCAVLAREAKFVADSGANGVIWPPADDAMKLLTADEERRGLEAIADALEGTGVYFCPCCPGKDTADTLRRITVAEEIAAKHPSLKMTMLVRLADDAKNDADHECHYESVAAAVKHPVIIQTYNGISPLPKMALMVELAKRHPEVYGWYKVEGSDKVISDLMAELVAAKPVVKTVFTGWGGRDWLYQYRQIGTRGVVTQRPMYADLIVAIWRALESGSAAADDLFAKFIYLRNLDDILPADNMRGWNLYVLKRRRIFTNMLSRVIQPDGTWRLEDVSLTAVQIAEIETRLRFAGVLW